SDAGDRRVAGAGHDLKDRLVLFGNAIADEADAGQVAVDASGLVELGPEVDQDEIAAADRRVGFGVGLVVRIAAVGGGCGDRAVVGGQPVTVEVVDDGGLDRAFADGAAVPGSLGDQVPGHVVGRLGVCFGFAVHPPLLIIPGGLEELREVA